MNSQMGYAQAIERAIDSAMTADPRVLTFGEDVRLLRRNLLVGHGADRVMDAPISESAFLGAAVTAAMSGLRPIVEIMLVDFIAVAFDGILNHAAKNTAFSGGTWDVPLVVRASCGGGYADGGQHEQVLWGLLGGIPGIDVVVPSTPADAAGLMTSAIASKRPVVFLEHKLLSDYWLDYLGGNSRPTVEFDVPVEGANGPVDDPIQPVPIGSAVVRRRGSEVTLISLGVGVHRCSEAAESLAGQGVEATVVDLRSVSPLDTETVIRESANTSRVVVVDEDYLRGGLSGEIAALLAEADVPVSFSRVAVEHTIPYARHLEHDALPNVERILAAVHELR